MTKTLIRGEKTNVNGLTLIINEERAYLCSLTITMVKSLDMAGVAFTFTCYKRNKGEENKKATLNKNGPFIIRNY